MKGELLQYNPFLGISEKECYEVATSLEGGLKGEKEGTPARSGPARLEGGGALFGLRGYPQGGGREVRASAADRK